MIAEKIKLLRANLNMTQNDVAKKLGITRAGVNAWEMGISIPSTTYIVELAKLFGVSTDYLLGLTSSATISVEGLSEDEVAAVARIVHCLVNKGCPS